jgi:hypothetical protein
MDCFVATLLAMTNYIFRTIRRSHVNWNNLLRQTHRWLSIAFTAAVIVNVIAMVQQQQAVWIGLLALFPLIFLLLTGLYLFALPYLTPRRIPRGSTSAS